VRIGWRAAVPRTGWCARPDPRSESSSALSESLASGVRQASHPASAMPPSVAGLGEASSAGFSVSVESGQSSRFFDLLRVISRETSHRITQHQGISTMANPESLPLTAITELVGDRVTAVAAEGLARDLDAR